MRENYAPADRVDAFVESLCSSLSGTRSRAPLPDLSRSALMLLDLQRIFVDPSSPAYLPAVEGVAARINGLLQAFRSAGRPVIWTRHIHPPGDEGGTIARHFGRLLVREDPLSALGAGWQPGADEVVVSKSRHSAFSAPALSRTLADRDVGQVVLAGVQTHLCVLATAVEAGSRDLMPVVALDATCAPTQRLHRAALVAFSGGLGWSATVAEITGALSRNGSDP